MVEAPKERINNQIRVPQVRIGGSNIETPGIYPIAEALKMADDLDLDLVEIAPGAEPPVCLIVDFSKYLFDKKRKSKELKAKTVQTEIKELRFGPNTDEHDYNFKLNHATKFLLGGSKVKATVLFSGRAIVFKDQGEILLLRFASDLEEYGKVDQMPKLEGRRMAIFISPKKKK